MPSQTIEVLEVVKLFLFSDDGYLFGRQNNGVDDHEGMSYYGMAWGDSEAGRRRGDAIVIKQE